MGLHQTLMPTTKCENSTAQNTVYKTTKCVVSHFPHYFNPLFSHFSHAFSAIFTHFSHFSYRFSMCVRRLNLPTDKIRIVFWRNNMERMIGVCISKSF